MRIRTIPLVNGAWTNGLTSPWVSPELPRGMHDAVIAIVAEQTIGAPSAATLTPSIQLLHATVGGNWVENGGGGGDGLYPANAWQTLDAATNPSLLPDGNWAAMAVQAATTSAPVYAARRIGGGFPWRLRLDWAFTGGSNPKTQFSVNLYIREFAAGGFDRVESGA